MTRETRTRLRVLEALVEAGVVVEVDEGEEEDVAGEVVVLASLRVESRVVRRRINGKSRTRLAVRIITDDSNERRKLRGVVDYPVELGEGYRLVAFA